MCGIEENIGRIARPKFQTIAALQFLTLDALAIHECAVLAAQVDQKELLSFLLDLRVVARNPWICDDQILINLSSNGEGGAVQDDILLLTPLHKDKGGKHTGARSVMADCAQGHGWLPALTVALAVATAHAVAIYCSTRLLCGCALPQGTGMAPPGV
jgi:hypothetical protein